MKKPLLLALVAAILSGCAAFPEHYETPVLVDDVAKQQKDQWSSTQPITRVVSATGVAVRKFNDVPAALRNQAVQLKLDASAPLTIADLVTALRAHGLRVATSLKETGAAEVPADFNGTLGDLLDLFAAEQNIAYEFRNDTVFLTEAGRYVVTLPQHEEFLKKIAEAVKEMGGTNVRSDVRAGRLYYSAKPDVAQYLEEYIATIGKNSAMVNLQVAVITVRLTRDVNLGLDWSKLQVGGGRGDLGPGVTPLGTSLGSIGKGTGSSSSSSGSGTSGGTTGSGSTTGSGTEEEAIKLGTALGFIGGSGFAAQHVSSNFSLAAAINALSTYGNARAEQNVIMGTLSGLGVKIGSGNEIPYVKKIGSSTASGGSTSGSAETDIVKSGLTLQITPSFAADDNSVVTTMDVDMSSLVAFRELTAGKDLGTLSYPEMQKLVFSNVGRLQVGETLVVGGITYDQLDNNYTALPGMEKQPLGSKAEKTSRYAVYIVVRPTVTVFEAPAPAPKPIPVAAPALPLVAPAVAPAPVEPRAVATTPEKRGAAPGAKRNRTLAPAASAPATAPKQSGAASAQAAAPLAAAEQRVKQVRDRLSAVKRAQDASPELVAWFEKQLTAGEAEVARLRAISAPAAAASAASAAPAGPPAGRGANAPVQEGR